MPFKNSSKPLRRQVSLSALSALHLGQVLVNPLSPSYQISTQCSQPMIVLQQRENIIGGCMVSWQMQHLKLSERSRRRAKGILRVFWTVKREVRCPLMSIMSFSMWSVFAFFGLGILSSEDEDESAGYLPFGFLKDFSFTA